MAKTFNNKLVGQIGEHLVTAELGRRNIIATPFSGNVPYIDILAYANNRAIPIQVKAISAGDWQLNLRDFLAIEFAGDRQIIKGLNPDVDKKLVCVFVKVGQYLGEDKFFIFRRAFLQKLISVGHETYLKRHKGMRPRNPKSMHTRVTVKQVEKRLNRWDVIERALGFPGRKSTSK